MEEQKKTVKRIVRAAEALILVVVLGYMAYSAFVLKKPGTLYPYVIGGGILAIWLIDSVIYPIKSHEFEGKTPQQISAYRKYAALGLLGYLGLIYFAISPSSSNGFYGAIVYVIAIMFKRRFMEEYTGTADEEAGDDVSGEEQPEGELPADPLSQDAAGREERMRAAGEESGQAEDMKSRLDRLNELADEIEETKL